MTVHAPRSAWSASSGAADAARVTAGFTFFTVERADALRRGAGLLRAFAFAAVFSLRRRMAIAYAAFTPSFIAFWYSSSTAGPYLASTLRRLRLIFGVSMSLATLK